MITYVPSVEVARMLCRHARAFRYDDPRNVKPCVFTNVSKAREWYRQTEAELKEAGADEDDIISFFLEFDDQVDDACTHYVLKIERGQYDIVRVDEDWDGEKFETELDAKRAMVKLALKQSEEIEAKGDLEKPHAVLGELSLALQRLILYGHEAWRG